MSEMPYDLLKETIKWSIKKEIRQHNLKKNEISMVYCANTREDGKEHEIEIQENRGKYSFIQDNKKLYTADSLAECVRWAKAAGRLDTDEKIVEMRKAAPATASKTTSATEPGEEIIKRLFGNRQPVYGRQQIISKVFSK